MTICHFKGGLCAGLFPGLDQYWRLQEVSGSGQEIVWHRTPIKQHFYTWVFVQIKQTRWNVLICCRGAGRWVLLTGQSQASCFPPFPVFMLS